MATLKISDLSVGDWVEFHRTRGIYIAPPLFDHANAQVIGTHRGAEVSLLVDGKREFIAIPLSAIRPIPITAEILEKNGFMLLSDSFSTYEYATLLGKMLRSTRVYLDAPQSISVSLQDTTIERGFYHREKTSVRILRDELYVHDLQHALRVAGVDKEINL
jgi:hypothetical protein